uniref:Uncharacterized protein n=1 Tax=Chromera velia CCMP2878 TaxID=1169474 RepID=A0A0G4GAI2_9ALVE|eukprot:Cvel_21006.t1-p1 / transcript=Cvel_21006.t1 / gene=Cvel_21006 / organism=Chromera_velia_CCMP2878 / gene_product=hypothetical protein / transcript_product=hypothetical protein / location=Cvel_scaffold1935:17617-21964(+) / protein_length=530 / sequence_SO=supercontig / SO=protein_coding / is_pseudo=false
MKKNPTLHKKSQPLHAVPQRFSLIEMYKGTDKTLAKNLNNKLDRQIEELAGKFFACPDGMHKKFSSHHGTGTLVNPSIDPQALLKQKDQQDLGSLLKNECKTPGVVSNVCSLCPCNSWTGKDNQFLNGLPVVPLFVLPDNSRLRKGDLQVSLDAKDKKMSGGDGGRNRRRKSSTTDSKHAQPVFQGHFCHSFCALWNPNVVMMDCEKDDMAERVNGAMKWGYSTFEEGWKMDQNTARGGGLGGGMWNDPAMQGHRQYAVCLQSFLDQQKQNGHTKCIGCEKATGHFMLHCMRPDCGACWHPSCGSGSGAGAYMTMKTRGVEGDGDRKIDADRDTGGQQKGAKNNQRPSLEVVTLCPEHSKHFTGTTLGGDMEHKVLVEALWDALPSTAPPESDAFAPHREAAAARRRLLLESQGAIGDAGGDGEDNREVEKAKKKMKKGKGKKGKKETEKEKSAALPLNKKLQKFLQPPAWTVAPQLCITKGSSKSSVEVEKGEGSENERARCNTEGAAAAAAASGAVRVSGSVISRLID